MSQRSARPSLIVHSTALRFATGSAPGCARQTGHVRVFGSAKYSSSQRQNIFVRVFRCTWISSPTTASQSLLIEHPLRIVQRAPDVAVHLDHAEAVLERAAHLDQPERSLAGLKRKLEVARENRAGAVEHSHVAERVPARDDEVGGRIDDRLHRSRSGVVSKSSARSSACATRKRAFSESCGPTSCRPTGSPSLRPHGMLKLGSPAMFGGIASTSARYIESGSTVLSPSLNATVGDVGDTSTSNRSKSSACSRMMIVRTFCACP